MTRDQAAKEGWERKPVRRISHSDSKRKRKKRKITKRSCIVLITLNMFYRCLNNSGEISRSTIHSWGNSIKKIQRLFYFEHKETSSSKEYIDLV